LLEEVARELAGRPDEEIKAELMKRLGKSNYIAPAAEAAYENAFFREYKKSIGEPVPEESIPARCKSRFWAPAARVANSSKKS
jgi:hypothetical protein